VEVGVGLIVTEFDKRIGFGGSVVAGMGWLKNQSPGNIWQLIHQSNRRDRKVAGYQQSKRRRRERVLTEVCCIEFEVDVIEVKVQLQARRWKSRGEMVLLLVPWGGPVVKKCSTDKRFVRMISVVVDS
jgi:hypothetical protein